MREKPSYRDHLADLLEYTGGKRLMTTKEVAAYLGVSRQTAAKRFGVKGKEGILVVELARTLAK